MRRSPDFGTNRQLIYLTGFPTRNLQCTIRERRCMHNAAPVCAINIRSTSSPGSSIAERCFKVNRP